MDRVLQELRNYSRWLQLEADFPRLEEAVEDAKELSIDAGGRVRLAQWELERLENPGFLQRLKGNLEERKDICYREYRAAQAQLQQVREELELRGKELQAARAEFADLSFSWEAYIREKERAGQTSEEERILLTGICIGLTRDCQDALEQARNWMRQDVLRTGVSIQNRKMEFLALANEKAARITGILDQLPEGTVQKPACLPGPEAYVTGVSIEYKQLDRVNQAIEQIRTLRQQLQEL